jgi:deoxyribodipyrimidine photo-lyase
MIICWLRRDLRLDDHAALYHALKQGKPVLPLFIFDTSILDQLADRHDSRVAFIHHTLQNIHAQLTAMGSSLLVMQGTPEEVWKKLVAQYKIDAVYAAHDYEPYARRRDKTIGILLLEKNIPFRTCKDQVIFEKDEVLKDDGKPYTVFTPFSKKWRAKLNPFYYKSYPTENYFSNLQRTEKFDFPSLEQIGFTTPRFPFPVTTFTPALLSSYQAQRDFPAIEGTSKLGLHLRFGTVSVRRLLQQSLNQSDTWTNELIWREFFMMILWHFPHVVKQSFKPDYDRVVWRNNEAEFAHWCAGTTGYPIVDAGMRELNATGFMHNRVRMVTASFLIKHLLIDWRWGEAYFAEKLFDFDLSANNGNWQWASSGGCDAAPYFRIFNPTEQQRKFDPDEKYIRKWVPEYGTAKYPKPIVDHKMARERCLAAYKAALKPE